MRDIRIITGKRIMPDCTESLRMAGYQQNGWEQGMALFQKLERFLRIAIQPKAAMAFAVHPSLGRVLYVVLTLGPGIQRKTDAYFAAHEYTEGLLFDAMADSCLFAFEEQLLPQIEALCREKQVGIAKRYEGGMNGHMSLQRDAAEAVEAARTLGVSVTKDDLLRPVKSMSLVYVLSDDEAVWAAAHDCQACQRMDCPLRKTEKRLLCRAGTPISSQLLRQQVPISFLCGGKGCCGKCRIRCIRGTLAVTDEDRRIFTDEELRQGWRLACRAVPTEDVYIAVPVLDAPDFAALGQQTDEPKAWQPMDSCGLAIDIGTTTIAVSLVNTTSQKTVQTVTAVNSQRVYGADVISRIQAANAGHLQDLQQCVRRDLQQLFQQLWAMYPLARDAVQQAVVSANTTMQHLLMGWDCRGLGRWPFEPYSLGGKTYDWQTVFGTADCRGTVILLPGISTYVGADITAGIWQCAMRTQKELSLFIDLGTNGEMAIGNQNICLTASTAAGPALEGSSLLWGTGSVPGAICRVNMQDHQVYVQTIQGAAPCGICGSGVIDAMAAFVQHQLVDTKGRLREPYFSHGFSVALTQDRQRITLSQQDIREIQMAKGAIRAGIEVLIKRAGAVYSDIRHVYLAGGFGYYVRPEKAGQIGLLPPELVARTTAIGNTSLQGAAAVVCDGQILPHMQQLARDAQEIVLSNDASFQEAYIHYMDF